MIIKNFYGAGEALWCIVLRKYVIGLITSPVISKLWIKYP